jgi:hypothetical protein
MGSFPGIFILNLVAYMKNLSVEEATQSWAIWKSSLIGSHLTLPTTKTSLVCHLNLRLLGLTESGSADQKEVPSALW